MKRIVLGLALLPFAAGMSASQTPGAGTSAVESSPAAINEERIRGTVGENNDPLCDTLCTTYYLEDSTGGLVSYLLGSYQIYLGLEIEISGFRASCFGCQTFTRTSPVTVITDVAEDDRHPVSYSISQNFPNPFNPSTTVAIDVPVESLVRLSVWDIAGREVSVLYDDRLAPGRHEFGWEPRAVAAGVYLSRLVAVPAAGTGGVLLSKAMLYLK
jgi:hypothetical protein